MGTRVDAANAQPNRVPQGGRIDRATTLSFRFDGRSCCGHPGDTLASALIANGVRLVGRSFKYHRPRGIVSAGSAEPNALVELRTGGRREPNTRATVAELYDGLEAASQNRWPSLAFDVMGANALAAPLLAAGFYYKTFMWPSSFWEKVYEPLIRRAAGLGRAARAADPDRYERQHLFCDVLVVGGGPAGLAAALAAGRAGARVALCEEDFALGGRLLSEPHAIGDAPASAWAARAQAELASLPNVRVLTRTTLFGVFDHGNCGALERVCDHLAEPPAHLPRQRYWKIVARRIVLAAGAIERPLVFPGNDRPGVMSAAAVRTYVERFAAVPGRRAVVFTAGDDGWRTVPALRRAGADIEAVVDARENSPAPLRVLAGDAEVVCGGRVVATYGHLGLSAVDIADARGRRRRLNADLLAVAGGWDPAVHLTCHLGGKPVWDETLAAFVPGTPPPGMTVAGAAAGRFSLRDALATGAQRGAAAAQTLGFAAAEPAVPACDDEPTGLTPFWYAGDPGKAFVDLQNDVTASDIALASREGYRAAEHAKRYTTLGMATDQGKTANVNGLAILAAANGRGIAETGTTTFRPPYTPVAIGAVAGHERGSDFRPARLTPTHDWAHEQGAAFVEAGLWLRAQWYPRDGETDWRASVEREVRAVRAGVGVCDVSTLGKVEVVGPHAARLLDFVYANTMSTLAVGRVRYGVMLREDGHVLDDGTVARLADDRFFLTTTTAHAEQVLQHIEFCHQALNPGLDVAAVSVTERWAQLAIAGPQARALMARLVDGFDLASERLPHMAAAATTVCGGVPARLYRLSFSGELGYELGVPADLGDALMREIMRRGADLGVTPYGTEAMGVLRIEKGHPAGGELNGQTTAHDLGLGGLLSKKKDFVGRALAGLPALCDPKRPALVSFVPAERERELKAGAHFLAPGAAATIDNDEGHMTSAVFSPTFGHALGLGLLKRGRERAGERVRAYDPVRGQETEVVVGPACLYDPKGERPRV